VNLVNSTVIGNSSTSDAGFAAGGLVTFGSGVMDSSNTLVAANTVGENNTVVNCGCTGGGCMTANGFDSSGFNLEDADTCNFADTSDLVDTDPMTTALGDYGGPVPTHGLLAGSPALDAASNDNCTATDARTLDRPSDGNADGTADCDIGAFELSSDEYDADGDGYCIGIDWGDGDTCVDGTTPGDCDDGEATAFPGNAETCDGIDNDCNDMIDDGLPTSDYYPDVDGDGFGDPNEDVIAACAMPADASDNNEDCDDTDAAVNPDATEVCDNGIDDNCNGMIDEGCDGDTDGGTDSGTASATDGMTSAGDTDTDTAGEDTGDEGCSCQTTPTTPGLGALMLGLLGLFARRRRRS
jgi:MYXO-CTERM domain-containing protein